MRLFPIMQGPSVPWDVMAPFEDQAQKNHSQSLQVLAGRGGLAPEEAWCVVNGLRWRDRPNNAAELWAAWAEKHGVVQRELEALRAELAETRLVLEAARKELMDQVDYRLLVSQGLEREQKVVAELSELKLKVWCLRLAAENMLDNPGSSAVVTDLNAALYAFDTNREIRVPP